MKYHQLKNVSMKEELNETVQLKTYQLFHDSIEKTPMEQRANIKNNKMNSLWKFSQIILNVVLLQIKIILNKCT